MQEANTVREAKFAQDNVQHVKFMLAQWQASARFWKNTGDAENLARVTKHVRSCQTRLQWANQRAALYSVQK